MHGSKQNELYNIRSPQKQLYFLSAAFRCGLHLRPTAGLFTVSFRHKINKFCRKLRSQLGSCCHIDLDHTTHIQLKQEHGILLKQGFTCTQFLSKK